MMNNKIHWKISYIGLGSNQDNPIKQIKNALVNMGKIERTRIIKKSSFYDTETLGPGQQPNFIDNPIGTSLNHLIFFSYITALAIIIKSRVRNIFASYKFCTFFRNFTFYSPE